MATLKGAKALGLDDCGLLAPGAKADIVLLDIHKPHWQPKFDLCRLLVYSGQAGDVDTVLVNGKILLQNKRLTTIDEERIFYETARCVNKFFPKAAV
jgi:5-methylthioadenosine/S-adenosylhomocysteine deaminase